MEVKRRNGAGVVSNSSSIPGSRSGAHFSPSGSIRGGGGEEQVGSFDNVQAVGFYLKTVGSFKKKKTLKVGFTSCLKR